MLFLVLLGGTEAGRLATGLRALGALVGGVVILCYLLQMPRQNDLPDRLVLTGLVLFLLTCVTSSAGRSSFEAATSAMAYVAAFYLARGAVATRRGGELAITVLGSLGIVIGLAFLILWGSIWLRWAMIPGAGPPPFDLRLPAFLYRHQYLVAMLAALLLPATLLLVRRPIIWPIALVGCLATFLVAFISGGRAIWLAGVAAAFVALLVAVVSARDVHFPRRWSTRLAVLAVTTAVLVVLAAPLVSRLSATSTIQLRLTMWEAALSHWLDSALVGYGPGSFAREFSLTGYYATYEFNVPHAHNVLVQILFEGGLLGLAGVGLVCAGVIVGVARHNRLHWSSAAAFAFFVFSSTADNPTVVPFLLAPLIVWAALASPRFAQSEPDRRETRQQQPLAPTTVGGTARFRLTNSEPRRWNAIRWLTLIAAGIVGSATLATLAAALAFDRAGAAAAAGRTSEVVENLSTAAKLDPAFALYHRELGVWLQVEGDSSAARGQLTLAMRLNPSDAQALRAAALLYAREGMQEQAVALASSTVVLFQTRVENALTLAYVNAAFENNEGQRSALVTAVRLAPWLVAAPEWRIVFPSAEPASILGEAFRSWQTDQQLSARNLKARAWLAGMVGAAPPEGARSAFRVQTAVLACLTDQARQELADLLGPSATELETLEAELMFANAYGEELRSEVETLIRLRDPGLAEIITHPAVGTSPVWSFFYDKQYYDRLPISPPGGPAFPTPASGLSAWLRDPVGAADRGAPDSGLADCR